MNINERIGNFLNEKKQKVKYEIDPSMEIISVGHDANGNWSYWLNVAGKKGAVKVQHEAFGKGKKITKDGIKSGDVDKTTIAEIKKFLKLRNGK